MCSQCLYPNIKRLNCCGTIFRSCFQKSDKTKTCPVCIQKFELCISATDCKILASIIEKIIDIKIDNCKNEQNTSDIMIPIIEPKGI
ncbi:hypothetical protein MXB_3223 [Myxobolus squamalis]|nr:hypothetical protein MXB_3223 [Myxobolus squamalis]